MSESTEKDLEASGVATSQTSLFSEKRKKGKQKAVSKSGSKMSKESLFELEERKEAEAMFSYGRLKQIWDAMLKSEESATNEWLLEAEKLIDMFRETRNLFGSRGVGLSRHCIRFECLFEFKVFAVPWNGYPAVWIPE